MDAAYNQVVLLFYGSLLSIPTEVPFLSEAQALATVPNRLPNPLANSIKLSEGPEEKEKLGITQDEFATKQEQLGWQGRARSRGFCGEVKRVRVHLADCSCFNSMSISVFVWLV